MIVAVLLVTEPARAWLLNEHTRITEVALEEFEHDWRAQGLLPMVRYGLQLCEKATDGCPTLADLPALAGDHSCTPSELRGALPNSWVRKVMKIGAQVEADLSEAGADSNERVEIKRQMHIDLQLKDEEYLIRAVLDYAHFQQPREDPQLGLPGLLKYMQGVLAAGRQANALAAYVNYHVAALRLANEARTGAAAQPELFVRAYLAEAFALHFLEDSFAAGHFVGHWGGDAMRIGTHDYYNRYGYETTQWNRPDVGYTARGDGFLSDQEVAVIKVAVVESLKQVVDAATNEIAAVQLLASVADVHAVEQLDSCRNDWVPPGLQAAVRSSALVSVLGQLPVPSLRDPQVPRVRIELGFFLGGTAALHGSLYLFEWRSHEFPQDTVVGGRSQAAVRFGYGLGDIVNDPLNAQAFADVGVIAEKRDTGRSDIGYSLRVRAPGFIFAPDGIIAVASSVIAKATQARCTFCYKWTAAAAGGGAGGLWGSAQITDSFAIQLSALRDGSVHWFPGNKQKRYRVELLFPVVTGRWVVPIAGRGDSWSQSTDMYVDIGPTITWGPEQPTTLGVFASTAIAGRLFP